METERNRNVERRQRRRETRPSVQEDAVLDQSYYRERARELLIKGGIGIAIGFVISIATSGDSFDLLSTFLFCFLFAGIPYGWQILGKIIGHWLVVGSLPVMFLAFFIQLVGSILIGWIAYPIALLYSLMNAQVQGSTAQKVYKVCLIGFAGFLIVFLLFALFMGK